MTYTKNPANKLAWRERPEYRGETRAPFAANNTAALVHGAHSERCIAERAAEITRRLRDIAPGGDNVLFDAEFDRYSRDSAVEELLSEHIFSQVDRGKMPHMTAFAERTAASRLAHQAAEKLGISPHGYAKMRAIVADTNRSESLADLIESGRQRRLRSEADEPRRSS